MIHKKNIDALIIGAGHNGLVCAYYLAKAGLNVHIFERRHIVGGAAVTEEFHPGFRNSVASYTVSLLNPQVISDMKLKEYGLSVVKRPISNFLPINDTNYLKLGGGLEKTQAEFRKFSERDAYRLPDYYDRIEAVADVLRDLSIKTPPNPKHGIKALMGAALQAWPIVKKGNQVHKDVYDLFTKSARSFLDSWFENEHIKAAFGFDAIVGNYASPDTPGSAYVLLHHVFGEVDGEKGAWGHAIGGMGAITQAMQQACVDVGVKITTNAPVKKVMVDGKRVTGIQLENGDVINASKVVSNLNPTLLYKKLIDQNYLDE
jgi:phytoene dehydrogenase-like protein